MQIGELSVFPDLLLLQGALFKSVFEGEEMISGKIRMLAVVFATLLMVSLFAMPTVSANELEGTTGSSESTGNNSMGTDKSAE